MEELKVGIVGCGYHARRIANSWLTVEKARLVAVCDVIKERADDMAKRYKAKAYYSLGEMFDSEEFDIISVCTPIDKHFEPTVAALEAGANVVVEKPLATNINDGVRMVKKAKSVGKALMVDYNRRWAMTWALSKEHTETGEMGRLCYILMRFQIGPLEYLDNPPYQILHDFHCHYFDLCRFIGGEVTQVYSDFSGLGGKETYKQAAASLRFANGAFGYILGSTVLFPHPPFKVQYKEFSEIVGMKKTMRITDMTQSWQIRDHATLEEIIQTFPNEGRAYDETFNKSLKAFAECVANGKQPPVTGEDGVKAIKLIEASIRSFEEKAPVKPY